MNRATLSAALVLLASVASAQTSQNGKPAYAVSMQVGDAQQPISDELSTPTRNLYLGVQLFSIIPSEGINSFRGTPAPGAMLTGIGGMVGPAYTDDDQRFGVKVSPNLQDGKLIAGVEITPWESEGNLITAREMNIDITDMKSTSVQLAKKQDGRIYLLSLTPSVEVQRAQPPKSIEDSYQLLEILNLNNSAAVLNGEKFLGTLTMSSGNLVFIDIPGYFDIKFSLVQFKNSTLSGELNDGTIRLTDKLGRQLDIYNVATVSGQPLPDGPYQVWAQWEPPKETIEQALQRELGAIEHAKKEGTLNVPDEVIDRMVERMKAGEPFMMGRGMTSVRKDERL